MKIYKFKQYKYHKINTNPHEGKLIWGGQVFIIFPKQFSDRGGDLDERTSRWDGRKAHINMILNEVLLSSIKLTQQQTSSYLIKKD